MIWHMPVNMPVTGEKIICLLICLLQVRIEDGVAVTADGIELLSHNVPRTVEEIEEFMNRS